MLRGMIGLSFKDYSRHVLIAVFFVTILAYIVPLFLVFKIESGWFRFFIIGISDLISCALFIYLFGLNSNEKQLLLQLIKDRVVLKFKSYIRK
jgi:hypothetical protein